MKRSEAETVMGLLLAGFPQQALDAASEALWVHRLQELEADATTHVVLQMVDRSEKFPSLAEIRLAVRQHRRRQAEAESMYEIAATSTGPCELPDEVKEWRVRVGWA